MPISPEGFDRLSDLVSDDAGAPTDHTGERRIGRYRILREVGRGGMAIVYEAEDPELHRKVALKVVREADAHPHLISRLRREAKIIAQLRHPHIVGVFEVGTARDPSGGPIHYIAMDLVHGRTFAQMLAGERPPRDTVLRLIEDVARAVAHAHARGVVHRDLKPGNVLIDENGHVQLVDFGLAYGEDFRTKLTASQAVLGTPQYMAPEQVRGESDQVGPHTDVYALGAILYEALSGRPPFEGRSAAELYGRILQEEPAPLAQFDASVDPALAAVCAKALEKDLARRYPSADEFADDLARARFQRPVKARPAGVTRRLARLWGRRRTWVAAAGAGLLGLAAVTAVLVPLLRSRDAQALEQLRKRTATALEALLALRRAGSLDQMQRFADETESACREAMREFPDRAEPHYILGRMHRARMDDGLALAAQDAALAQEAAHAGALTERVALTASAYERRLAELRRWSWRDAPSGRILEEARRAARDDEVAGGLLARMEADVQALRRIAAADPGGVPPGRMSAAEGLLAWLTGDAPTARLHLQAALEAAPDLEEAIVALASLELHDERFEESMALWTRGHEHDRGYAPFLEGRAAAGLAWGYELAQSGEPTAAAKLTASIADHKAALAAGPTRPEAKLRLGIALFVAGMDRSARGQDPVGFFREALAALETARGGLDEVALLVWSGIVHAGWGRWEAAESEEDGEHFAAALRDLDAALALRADDAGALLWRGVVTASRALMTGGRTRDDLPRLEQAVRDLDAAVARDPEEPEGWMWRGLAALASALLEGKHGDDRSGVPARFQKALVDLDRAVELGPRASAPWLRRGHAKMMWGNLHLRQRHADAGTWLEAAIADLREAVRLNPVQLEAWQMLMRAGHLLGGLRADQGKEAASHYRAALEAGAKAAELSPGTGRTHEMMGGIWEGLAQEKARANADPDAELRKAIECYEAVIQAQPPAESRLRARIVRLKARIRR